MASVGYLHGTRRSTTSQSAVFERNLEDSITRIGAGLTMSQPLVRFFPPEKGHELWPPAATTCDDFRLNEKPAVGRFLDRQGTGHGNGPGQGHSNQRRRSKHIDPRYYELHSFSSSRNELCMVWFILECTKY
jgi:hypothetical protein